MGSVKGESLDETFWAKQGFEMRAKSYEGIETKRLAVWGVLMSFLTNTFSLDLGF